MKNLMKTFVILALAISITSCDNDDDDMTTMTETETQTIAEIAVANPNLSILVEALQKAKLVSVFTSPGDYTVFAPTNDKFEAFLKANGFDSLDDVPEPVLKEILSNHVIGKSYTSSQLATGYVKTLAKGGASDSNTISMYIDLTSGVKINGGAANGGANVVLTSANIKASNGVIHVVDNVIGLPTIVNHAVANPNFKTLVSVVTSPAQSSILSALSSPGSITVFAPIDSGFAKLNTDLIGLGITGGIADVADATITNVLLYHVLGGNNLASSLMSKDYTTLLEQTFEVQLMGGAKIKDNNNRNSNIIITDVQCSNGVIHAIDNALLPSL